MEKYAILRKYNTLLLFFALIVSVLVVAKDVLVPMAWAFYFALVLYPVANRLERWRLTRVFSSLVIALTLFFSIVLLIVFFSSELIGFSKDITFTSERLQEIFKGYAESIQQLLGLEVAQSEQYMKTGLEKLGGWVIRELGVLGSSLSSITLMFVYLFFFLYYRTLFTRFISVNYSGPHLERMREITLRSSHVASGYLRGTLILTLLMAVLSLVVFWIFGVRHALFLALFVAVLNIIPYIGNLIAFVVVFLITYITKDSWGVALGVLACLYVANILQENIGRPLIVGTEMDINGFFVFVSVVIGGSIWGISGMVLFIPLVAVLKIALELNEHWKPAAILFGSGEVQTITPVKSETEVEK